MAEEISPQVVYKGIDLFERCSSDGAPEYKAPDSLRISAHTSGHDVSAGEKIERTPKRITIQFTNLHDQSCRYSNTPPLPSTTFPSTGKALVLKKKHNHPVIVPHLEKSTRGRRVPSADSEDVKLIRPNICPAEACEKAFKRPEHLKRHIRSIHTHEKAFKCPYLPCGKFFNRHDNLLQHLKVHKDAIMPPFH